MEQAKKLVREARKKQNSSGGIHTTSSGGKHHWGPVAGSTTTVIGGNPPLLSKVSGREGGCLSPEPEPAAKVWTTVGRGRDAVEVVRDDERCYGFLRRSGSGYQAWWSGEKLDDHLIGEFESEVAAIAAVMEAAGRSDQPVASGRC